MSYSVTSDNRELSEYVQSLLSATSSTTNVQSAGSGNLFSEALKQVNSSSDSPSLKNSGTGVLVLNRVLTGGSTLTSTHETQELSKKQGFDLLEQQAPSQVEWQKAFGKTTSENDEGWGVLETLGSGLMTAAKIAGCILPFV